MARRCVFCGSESDLTREHVLPDWLTQSGVDLERVVHQAGPLNVLPRQWQDAPFRTAVKMVCAGCNSGWLSKLENATKPVIAPLLHGESRRLPVEDQALLAAWTCKTALVSLLVSSNPAAPGAPDDEYSALYRQKDRMEPLPFSRYWIGSYDGTRAASIWVTPFVVDVVGADSPPGSPSGYAITLTLGRLLVQGVRFTQPMLEVDLVTDPRLLEIWPPADTLPWPATGRVDDTVLDQMNTARTLTCLTKGLRLSPFGPATDLPASALEGRLVRLPLYCGKHDAFYPAQLAQETVRTGTRLAFLTSCECPMAYIIRTELDGAHIKQCGEPEAIEAAYEGWPGQEFRLEDSHGTFFFKQED